jgi:hypothetical protein
MPLRRLLTTAFAVLATTAVFLARHHIDGLSFFAIFLKGHDQNSDHSKRDHQVGSDDDHHQLVVSAFATFLELRCSSAFVRHELS